MYYFYQDLILITVLGYYVVWLYINSDFWYITYTETKLQKRYKSFESRLVSYMYNWSKNYTYNFFLFGLTIFIGFFFMLLSYFYYDIYEELVYWDTSGQWDVFIYSMRVYQLRGFLVFSVIVVLLLFIIFVIYMLGRLLFIIYFPEYFKKQLCYKKK